MVGEHTISIAADFSRFPGGRYRRDGEASGEAFREDFLAPALRQYPVVTVELDGVAGYSASFLEEAFGGLVRAGVLQKDELGKRLLLRAGDQFRTYKLLVERYVKDARPAAALVA
jgi:hypothetical protein